MSAIATKVCEITKEINECDEIYYKLLRNEELTKSDKGKLQKIVYRYNNILLNLKVTDIREL